MVLLQNKRKNINRISIADVQQAEWQNVNTDIYVKRFILLKVEIISYIAME